MLELQAGSLSARIHPDAGGIIAALEWRGPDGRLHKLLHSPDGAVPSTAAPNKMGSWAMAPFANRAFDGVVDDGTTRFLVPDNTPSGGNIHGFGWQSAWDILGQTASHTALEHRRSVGPDPYRYRVRQEIRLDEAGMTVALSITNEADRALPLASAIIPGSHAQPIHGSA
jgi:aldose 1-epimerase